MTTTRTRRRTGSQLSEFQHQLADTMTQHLGYTVPPLPDADGQRSLYAAISRYAVLPFSNPPRLRTGCAHARSGVASVLCLDEDKPAVRCASCFITVPPVLSEADKEICRVCQTGSRRFAEYLMLIPGDDLIISVHLCMLCQRDLTGAN